MKQQYLILMIGLPGSGKSEKAAQLAKEYDAQIISTDDLRKQYVGKEGDISQDSQIFNLAYQKCRNLLASGESVIFDACNLSPTARKRVLVCCGNRYGIEKIAYILVADAWQCIEQDSKRERVCGPAVILSYAERYIPPKMSEGFTQVIRQRSQERY